MKKISFTLLKSRATLARSMVLISIIATFCFYNIMESHYVKTIESYRNSTPTNIKQKEVLKEFTGYVVSFNAEKGTLVFKSESLDQKLMIYYDVKEVDAHALQNAIQNGQIRYQFSLDVNERQFRETHNAYEFDYQKYLYSMSIIGQYHLKAYSIIPDENNNCFELFAKKRIELMTFIKNQQSPKISEYFNALILGNSDTLTEKKQYQTLGISHVFAISGMHFGLIYAFLYKCIKSPRALKSMIILGLLFSYWGLIGFSYSAGRAVLLVTYIELSRLLLRKVDVLSAVSFTNLVLLLLFPNAILAVSYQLSFIAYLLIAYVYQTLTRNKKFNRITGALYFALFIQIAFLPIQLYFFGSANVIAFLPNLIIVPMISALFPFLFLVPLLSQTWLMPMEKYISAVEYLSHKMPTKIIAGQIFTPYQLRILMMCLVCYLIFTAIKIPQIRIKKGCKRILVSFITLLIIVCGFDFKSTEIHFFDVGHGDASLIKSGHYSLLIDTGDLYTDLSQMLLKRDIYRINAVILSHAHSDHIGGLKSLIETHRIDQIFCNQETYEVIKDQVRSSTKVTIVKTPVELTLDKVKLTLIPTFSKETNDNAVAVWFDSESIKGIFLGDISGRVYEKFPSLIQDLDFIKVSHHGSKTGLSEAFLNAHQIHYAIISHNEKYLMPSAIAIEQLTEKHIKIYETYHYGEITLSKNSISTYINSKSMPNDK